MSRTYRKRCEAEDWWLFQELIRLAPFCYIWKQKDRNSKEFKKDLAKYHSDAYRSFREPGPSYWRNLTVERPHRRNSKKQIYSWMKNPLNYEVMILSRPKLVYWT